MPPFAMPRSAPLTVAFHSSDSMCKVPEPGSSLGISTRNTWPRGVGRNGLPLDRASISAVVLLAAERASARSSSLEERDHVVRLTLPSSLPEDGSRTGTAAHVKVHRLNE